MTAASNSSARVALVVASVHHGNTRSVAEAMASVLHADIMSPEEVTPDTLSQYDLVGFGSGIYFGRHHFSLRQLVSSVDQLPKQGFIFSTAGLPFLARMFHWSLRRALIRQGCRVLDEFSCRGWDTVGPLILFCGINRNHPNASDLDRSRQFALNTLGKIALASKQRSLDITTMKS